MDGDAVSGPRRRPPDGGYARGEETREKIIEAALAVFADEGYVGASTRQIAAAAGVNPPALQYYFHSKEGLHRACGEVAVRRVMDEVGPYLDRARRALEGDDREPVIDALCQMLARMARFAMMDIETETWRRFLNRCQADDIGPAFEVIQRDISDVMKGMCIELVARALGRRPDEGEVRLRTLLIMSQAAIFHIDRGRALTIVGWPDFDGERETLAMRVICENVRRLVAAP